MASLGTTIISQATEVGFPSSRLVTLEGYEGWLLSIVDTFLKATGFVQAFLQGWIG